MAGTPTLAVAAERIRVRLSGAVQGVGMRPFVHRLATQCGLSGFVSNGADGVTIEVEGSRTADFLTRLTAERPPLASIDHLGVETVPQTGGAGFVIRQSTGGTVTTRIVADAATCADCLRELFDPASRFFHYPFVNCTHCGPRYTITRRLPYDRPQTSMAGFPMCPACAADYADPANRRFHAEPIACPACGPRLSHPIKLIAETVRGGGIVALKGIGGFHLMCDARNEPAVAALRQRKGREAKPFAVMVANLASLDAIVRPTAVEAALAASSASPIVLMDAIPGALAASVSPGLARLGMILAYTPLHHLLFAERAGGAASPFALVATSANPGGEPLVVDDADAERRLHGIADLIVTHDRPIVIRADDSVMQVIAGAPSYLRRARGGVPDPIELAEDGPAVLALGAHLKSTVTVTRGREAFVSQHIGDLDTAETVRFWTETIDHLLSILDVRPDRVVCDLHPDYRSSQLADRFGLPVIRVQHHAAHIAAIAAEHRLTGPVLGLALDGHGLGPNGEAWGGEMLRVDGAGWRALGHLATLPLPGGDRAAREPWRMGVAALHAIGQGATAAARFPTHPLAGPLAARLASGPQPIVTSSLGRLFDAVAALLGVRTVQAYEGQAAMELEALVRTPRTTPNGWTWDGNRLSFAPFLAALDSHDPQSGAELFHGTLIAGLTEMALAGAAASGISTICIGGGCAMNRVLTEGLAASLTASGLTPILARQLPPNDGGLSLGQAVMARLTPARGD
jgi:hydrogenase maturation protein HypF